jgi:hypothetical protein
MAADAFRLGMLTGAVVGLCVIGVAYWVGELTLLQTAAAVVLCFPVYLVFVASLLSVWLGYDKDATALRPVYRSR